MIISISSSEIEKQQTSTQNILTFQTLPLYQPRDVSGLKEYNLKGSLHCFSGSLETAKIYTSMGYLLGIGGVVTFKNGVKLKEVVEGIDLEYLLLETDSPYLSPEPKRGKRNDSRNVKYIAEKVAEFKNVSVEEIAKITYENAINVFNII